MLTAWVVYVGLMAAVLLGAVGVLVAGIVEAARTWNDDDGSLCGPSRTENDDSRDS
jgi:hypothetical protein